MKTPGYNPAINQGMLWAYTDCLAKKGPVLRMPADGALVGADPVTGRNQQIDLSWEQLCLSTVYELQIAKDRGIYLEDQSGHIQRNAIYRQSPARSGPAWTRSI